MLCLPRVLHAGLRASALGIRGMPSFRTISGQLSTSSKANREDRRAVISIGKTGGRMVILGSGWGGLKVLSGIDTSAYEVIVLSPRNHFVFTPLLAGSAVGTLEFRNITEPVRRHNLQAHYHQAWCQKIDLQKRELTCAPALPEMEPFKLTFDKLVIAVGAHSNTFNIPGVEQHGFFLKEISHAQRVRASLIECFERASEPNVTDEQQWKLLHFAVVGGGPTGIEFAAELHDFIKDDLRRLYPTLIDKAQITVFDVAEKILGSFDSELAAYATRKFAREGIKIRTRTFIQEVRKNTLVLKDTGEEIPFGVLVWATGLTATPLIKAVEATHSKSMRLMTDEYLRVLDKEGKAIEDVFACGDCAEIKYNLLPATAQVASQQGIFLRKYLNAVAKGSPEPKPFHYRHMGSMAYIGGWQAIMDLGQGKNLPKSIRGYFAWLAWRSAYLYKSVSARNMVLIPITWFLTFVFGRDISKF
ncbi:NDE1, mitochondrial external NADH dehydrogenase [Geranomyces variabilis]|nr:NDE1, mitochondrial external NADH dehydrogenase [Geranomyces variabilis]KAJ3135282.1 hypothetical protein HDU90_004005 [Geranomyces variabilis]